MEGGEVFQQQCRFGANFDAKLASKSLKLGGVYDLDDEQIKEASWVVHDVVGASAYLHGTGCSGARFKKELNSAVAHIRKSTHNGRQRRRVTPPRTHAAV